MKKTFIHLFVALIFYVTATDSTYCQSQTDTSREDISKVFVREEVKPSFAMGADSLNNYLTQNVNISNAAKNKKGIVKFIVSGRGNIYKVTKMSGDLSFEEALKSTLLKNSGQWNSGMQNGHHVNAYCTLSVTLHKNRIKAVIQ